MLGLTADWRRVVADWGSIAVELGDTYSGAGGYGSPDAPNPAYSKASHNDRFEGRAAKRFKRKDDGWPLAKSLCGIPTLYTWSLAYGRNLLTGTESPAGSWRIRNLLTWTRPNPPVGALGDKFRPATSFVTVATVDERRWFDLDAVRERKERRASRDGSSVKDAAVGMTSSFDYSKEPNPAGAPPLDWWEADHDDWQPLHRLPPRPYQGLHYAAFPVDLPRRLIEAMCPRDVCTVCGEPRRRITKTDQVPTRHALERPKSAPGTLSENMGQRTEAVVHTLGWTDCGHGDHRNGIVLDPFGGSGTTAVAAAQTGRDAILIDLDHRNVDLTRQRIADAMPVLREVASRPVPRTDEEGRAGRTPTKGGHIRPIATVFTWHVDGTRPAPAKPKPAPPAQLALAL